MATFYYQQVYRHQIHRAKFQILLETPVNRAFEPLKTYLAKLEHNFPHQLFQSTEHRSSKYPAKLWPPIVGKENHATRTVALVSPTAITAAASGKLMKNAQRQEACSLSQPPRTGPTAVVIAVKPDHVPPARGFSRRPQSI